MKKKISKPEEKTSSNLVIWLLIVAFTALCFYANYHYSSIAAPLKLIGWIAWLLISLLMASTTQVGKNGIVFAKESRNELRKISWPTRQETIQTTLIVMVMVTITGVILWGVDSGFMWIVGKLTRVNG